MNDATFLKEASDRDITLRYVSSTVSFYFDHLCRLRVLFRDVALEDTSITPAQIE